MLNEVVIDRGMKPQLCNLQARRRRHAGAGAVGSAALGLARLDRLDLLATGWPGWTRCQPCCASLCPPQCYADQNHVTVVQGDGGLCLRGRWRRLLARRLAAASPGQCMLLCCVCALHGSSLDLMLSCASFLLLRQA